MLIAEGSVGLVPLEEGRGSPCYANMSMLAAAAATEFQSSVSSPEELYAEFHTNMSQFREPPPYPGPPKHSNQPGLRQSFSGSEASTDVSVSSTENLASCQRQEPQGEETSLPVTCVALDATSDYSILARLGMPPSALEATSSLEPGPSAPPHIYVTGNTGMPGHGPHFATSPMSQTTHGARATTPNFYVSSESGFSSASTSSCKLPVLEPGTPPAAPVHHMLMTDHSASVSSTQSVSNFTSPSSVSSYNSSTLYANYPPWSQLPAMEAPQPGLVQLSGTPAAHMLPQYISSLPPPPQYPAIHSHQLDRPELARRSYEIIGRGDFPGSRSQPDLTHFWDSHRQRGTLPTGGNGSDRGSQHSIENVAEAGLSAGLSGDTSIDHIAAQATRMVEVLTDENKGLRDKLTIYDRKVSKLQKFELEIQKVNEGYEGLVKSSQKREYLEVVLRRRLEEEVSSLKALQRGLIRQLEGAGLPVPDPVLLASTDPTDSSMAALLAKHKELLIVKERQDMELEALQATVEQQRAQIDILRSVQANTRTDEETQRQQIIAEYDGEIQKELASIKAVYEKKEVTERNIREKLEREVQQCRQQHAPLAPPARPEAHLDASRELNTADIKRRLDEKEAKILQLEKQLITWKEQHLEESIRKLKLQEADSSAESTPRLPTYEQAGAAPPPSMSTESLINEAKAEKLKQVEEIYQANRRMAELEATVKSLQSAVSEKDAMLRVYQRSPMTRSSSVHTIYCTPHHSPRPSLTASMTGSLSRQSSQEAAALLYDMRHKKTGSTSALETAAARHSHEDLFEKIHALHSQSKSTSDTEDGSGNVWQV